jgi:hypothetical protein
MASSNAFNRSGRFSSHDRTCGARVFTCSRVNCACFDISPRESKDVGPKPGFLSEIRPTLSHAQWGTRVAANAIPFRRCSAQ